MDIREGRHLPQPEDTGREPNDEEVGATMECGADDLRARLIEVMALVNAPSSIRNFVVETTGGRCDRSFIVRIRLIAGLVDGLRLPCEHGAVSADRVYLHRDKHTKDREMRLQLRTVLASLEKKAFNTASL